jgi:MFS family permease
MSMECAIFIVGVIIQVITFSTWVQITIGRFVNGLSVGGLSAAVPIVRSRSCMCFGQCLIQPTYSTKLRRPRLRFVEP